MSLVLRRSHPQRVGHAIARVDAERMTRPPDELSLDTVGDPIADVEVRLDGAAHLATDLLQDQRALALERSLRAGLAEGARRGDVGREEPAGDDRGEQRRRRAARRARGLAGRHWPVRLIQACRVTGLVSGWLDSTTTVTRIIDVGSPGGQAGRANGRSSSPFAVVGSTYWMQTLRANVWLFPAWMSRVREEHAEARRERRCSREPGTARRGRIQGIRGGDVPSAGADLLDALLRESRGDAIGSRRRDPRAALAEHERDADHGDADDHGHREDLDDAESRGSPKRRAQRRPVHRTSVADAARVGDLGWPSESCG